MCANGEIKDQALSIVLFGATGDLAQRKLFPAFYNLYLEDLLPERLVVVGIGRRVENTEEFEELICSSIRKYSRKVQTGICEEFLEFFEYCRMDIKDEGSYRSLNSFLSELDRRRGTRGNRIFYLAVAPQLFGSIVEQLKSFGLGEEGEAGWPRLMIEKPFGSDLRTARRLNEKIRGVFPEEHIYRIDHYLGKEMIRNLMIIRFGNSLFEPLWNGRYIDHIQISASEMDGVGVRAGYYDQAGALKDMVQNHMLQLLTLITMEPPVDLETDSIRNEKVKILRSLSSSRNRESPLKVVRGQYGPGKIGDEEVCGYRKEDGVDSESRTETFVAIRLQIDNFRWSGVPIFLRTGKRLPRKSAEIVIQFRALPGVLYFDERPDPNLLVIKIQPEEGVHMRFNAKKPGAEEEIAPVKMNFYHSQTYPENSPESYERLIHDAISGNPTLFTRWDEVAYSWQFVDRITADWGEDEKSPSTYPAGTWGPQEAETLIHEVGQNWWNEI